MNINKGIYYQLKILFFYLYNKFTTKRIKKFYFVWKKTVSFKIISINRIYIIETFFKISKLFESWVE